MYITDNDNNNETTKHTQKKTGGMRKTRKTLINTKYPIRVRQLKAFDNQQTRS